MALGAGLGISSGLLGQQKQLQDQLSKIMEICEARDEEYRAAERLKETCGLSDEELRIEIEARRYRVMRECGLGGYEPVACNHCVPGLRHPIGNCYVCGWGPAPAHISWYGLKPLPIHEVNATSKALVN
jgi:hypothetical protein